MRRRRLPALERERLELPDGDFLDVCWTRDQGGPLVAVFHGLEGGLASHYVAPLLRVLEGAGWQAALMLFRGCSGEPNRLDRSYHSGETGDPAYFLDLLARRRPGSRLAAVGFSLGGNALLKYLGERGTDTPLAAAVAVSVPFELAAGAQRLERGMSRLYQRHLLGHLRAKIAAKFRRRAAPPGLVDLDRLGSLNTFRLFDDAVTAPLHGFAGVDDYYRRCSSRGFLPGIRIPTLVIHALDDPFLTPAAIPSASELPGTVTLELSPSGGHVGFVGGAVPGLAEYWLDRRIPEFLRDHLQ